VKKIFVIIVIMCVLLAGEVLAKGKHEARQKATYSGLVRSDSIPTSDPCSMYYPYVPCVKECHIVITPEGIISDCP
jgi:nitrate reductase gamma subunit